MHDVGDEINVFLQWLELQRDYSGSITDLALENNNGRDWYHEGRYDAFVMAIEQFRRMFKLDLNDEPPF